MSEDRKNGINWVNVSLILSVLVVGVVLAMILYSMKQQVDTLSRRQLQAQQAGPARAPGETNEAGNRPTDPRSASPYSSLPTLVDADTWDPFSELYQMQEQINGMFDNAFGRFNQSPEYRDLAHGIAFTPEIDVLNGKNAVTIKVDLPGVQEGNVNVDVKGRQAVITGERVENEQETNDEGKVIRRERRVGKFSRTIELPAAVDPQKKRSKCEAGVYVVTLPKVPELPESADS